MLLSAAENHHLWLIMVPFHGHDIISPGSVDSFSLSVPRSQMSTGLAYANEALCWIVPL